MQFKNKTSDLVAAEDVYKSTVLWRYKYENNMDYTCSIIYYCDAWVY